MVKLPRRLERYKQGLLTLFFVLVILAGVGAWLLVHRSNSPDALRQSIVAKVSKLAILPTDETPALASVVDKSKLQDNTILQEAENGDYVLIYTKNAKIIIYRPSDNKIVDIGPLITGTNGSIYVTSKIYIVNGSGQAGAYAEMAQKVLADFPNARVAKGPAATREYPQTLIADATGNSANLDSQVAETLNIHTGTVPSAVNPPADADFVIIIGTDFNG